MPPAQRALDPHAQHARQTHARTITNGHRPETKLPALPLPLQDLRKRIHVHQSAQQALPKHDPQHAPHVRQERVHALQDEQEQVEALQQGRGVQGVDAQEGRRGAGEEDAGLVGELVGGVEGAVGGEGRAGDWKEERGGHGLVDGVFGGVDEEEGEHARGRGCYLGVGVGG